MEQKRLIGSTIPVLYEDNHLLVVCKPAGVIVQKDITGDADLLSLCKRYIKQRYNKPGNVYLGLVHRLDRPVSGVVVFARTSKAARRLSDQIRNRAVGKKYTALVEGACPKKGRWEDEIGRKGRHAFLAQGGKRGVLTFKKESSTTGLSKMSINLETGRHHQIRLQFGSRGFPVVGDKRYGSRYEFYSKKAIALHSHAFTCLHPTRRHPLTFTCGPSGDWNDWWGMQKGRRRCGI